MKIPTKIPEAGFYYHYKHDPLGAINNYAYEVIGVGIHTEDDCRPEDANMVVYRPLYEVDEFEGKRFLFLRPIEMLQSDVTKNGKTFPRFSKISAPEIISKFEAIKKEMYEDCYQC